MINQLTLLLSSFLLIASCADQKERLLFSSSRNGNSDIFVMDTNGEHKRALTQSNFEEWGPTWINESEISFLRQTEESIVRLRLNLNSNEESKLNHPPTCQLDDKNVLYFKGLQTYMCKGDIYLFNSATSETINLTDTFEGVANYPSWSHDGKSIVFTSDHLGNNQLFEYDIDSKKLAQLTTSDANNERGELSPDRKSLVYSSDYFEKGNQDIVLKDLESGEVKNVTKSTGMELIARFSNDGKTIYYGTNQDGNWEIYAFDTITEKQTRLTEHNAFDGDPRIFKSR